MMSKPPSENVLQDELQRLQLALQKKSRQLSRCDKILSARKHVRATLQQHGAGDALPSCPPSDERNPKPSLVEIQPKRHRETALRPSNFETAQATSVAETVKDVATTDDVAETKGTCVISCQVAESHCTSERFSAPSKGGDADVDACGTKFSETKNVQEDDPFDNRQSLCHNPDEFKNSQNAIVDFLNDKSSYHPVKEASFPISENASVSVSSNVNCRFQAGAKVKKAFSLSNEPKAVECPEDALAQGSQRTPAGRNVTFREGSPDIFFVSPQLEEETEVNGLSDGGENVSNCDAHVQRFEVDPGDGGQVSNDDPQSLLSSQTEDFGSQAVSNLISPLRSVLVPLNRVSALDVMVPSTITIEDSLWPGTQRTKENASSRPKLSLNDDTIDLSSTLTQDSENESSKMSDPNTSLPPSKKAKKVESSTAMHNRSGRSGLTAASNMEFSASLESTCLSPIATLSNHFILSPAFSEVLIGVNGSKKRRSKLSSNTRTRDSCSKSNLKEICVDSEGPTLLHREEKKLPTIEKNDLRTSSFDINSSIHEEDGLYKNNNNHLDSSRSDDESSLIFVPGASNTEGRDSLNATTPWDGLLEGDPVTCSTRECLGQDDTRRVLCSSVCSTADGAALLLVCGDGIQLWCCPGLAAGLRWTKRGEQRCQWPEVDPSSFMVCCLIEDSESTATSLVSIDVRNTFTAQAFTSSLNVDNSSVAGAAERGAWCRFVVLGRGMESTTVWTLMLVECERQSSPQPHQLEEHLYQIRLITSTVNVPLYSEVQSACSGVLSCSSGPWTIAIAHSSLLLGVGVLSVVELEVVHRARWRRRELLCEPRLLNTDTAPLKGIQGLLRHTGSCEGVIVGLTESSILLVDAKLDLLLTEITLNLSRFSAHPPLSPIPSAPFPGSPSFMRLITSRSPPTEYNSSFIRTPPSSPIENNPVVRLDFPDEESPFSRGESFFSKSAKDDTELQPYFHKDIVRSPRTVSSNVNGMAVDLDGLLCAVQTKVALMCVCRLRDGVSCLLSCNPLLVAPEVVLGAVLPLPNRCSEGRDHDHPRTENVEVAKCSTDVAPTKPPCLHGFVSGAALTRSSEVLLSTDLGCVYWIKLQPRVKRKE